MTDDFFHKEGIKLVMALPIYLCVQVAILLMTFLDYPVYMDAYLANHNTAINGWSGAWFLLEMIGFVLSIIILFSKRWKINFGERERVKLGASYFLGAVAGLVTLGLRFMAMIPAEYFLIIGGIVLLAAIAYLIWSKRQPKLDEIFP
jgi:hypothetical protein